MASPIEARCFKGTEDILPEKMIPRRRMLAEITSVFESYGFAPLETPAMEYLDVLLAKSGEENAKLIYRLAYKGGDVLGLRFDLTVPLARCVAMRPELPLPFRRYQIQPVWRGERAQTEKGRYREFYQCDVDTVGTASLIADAENVAVCFDVYTRLGITPASAGLIARINSRKVLRAIVEASGLPAAMDGPVCTALDKIDKIGREEVEKLLAEAGVDAAATARLFAIIGLSDAIGRTQHATLLDALEKEIGASEIGRSGCAELRELFSHLSGLGVPADALHLDLVLTRGLDYYTGPIYEFNATKLEGFGSLGGGGRYDDLIGLYCGRPTPATGVCIGLSRTQEAIERLGLAPERRSTPSQALVMRLPDSDVASLLAVVSSLRRAGVAAELYFEPDRFKKQIQHADKLGIPFVVIQGPDEAKRGVVQVKDIRAGQQTEVPLADLAGYLGSRAS